MFASGLIYSCIDDNWQFLGSSGAYLRRDQYLTAAHCVPDGVQLFVIPGGNLQPRPVISRLVHPTADLALLRVTMPTDDSEISREAGLTEHFFFAAQTAVFDEPDFACHGYPTEGADSNMPTARTFKGHMLRWFNYEDSQGRKYSAYEMNCPAPMGLSGSLVSLPSARREAFAVVTANHEAYAIVNMVSEVDDDGVRYVERTNRVVSYGIAASIANGAWVEKNART